VLLLTALRLSVLDDRQPAVALTYSGLAHPSGRESSQVSTFVFRGGIFCKACCDELSLKKSTIEKHVNSAKHSAGKEDSESER